MSNNVNVKEGSYEENHIFNQYTIIVKNSQNRNSLKNYLNENGVSSMVYYLACGINYSVLTIQH